MNARKSLLLLGVSLVSLFGLQAQNDTRYLDDSYYSRRDIKKIDEEQRREAARREAIYRAEREAWEKKQAELVASYKRKKADQELDAYNGHLALPEDTIQLTRAELARLLADQRRDKDVRVWGPYSSRLQRFYGDGSTIIDGARRVYIDTDPWGDLDYRVAGPDVYVSVGSRPYWGSRWDWDWDWSWGASWHMPSWSWGYSSWSYPRWGGWYGGYDPYWGSPYWGYSSWGYPGWGSYWNGYYGGYYGNYWGGYYDGYWGSPYSWGYAEGRAYRAYSDHYYNNKYAPGVFSNGALSQSRASRSAYSAYTAVRDGEVRDGVWQPRSTERSGYSTSRGYEPQSYDRGSYQQSYPARSYDRNVPYEPRRHESYEPYRSQGSSSSSGGYRSSTSSSGSSSEQRGTGGSGSDYSGPARRR